MRIAGLAAFVGITALSLLGPTPPAAAADCKALVKPSPFGPDDQTGATCRRTSTSTDQRRHDIMPPLLLVSAGVELSRHSALLAIPGHVAGFLATRNMLPSDLVLEVPAPWGEAHDPPAP